MNDGEIKYDNKVQVKYDLEKLKNKGITSPLTPKKDELRIGNCVFYPINEHRRKIILERYGFESEEELEIYNRNYGKN